MRSWLSILLLGVTVTVRSQDVNPAAVKVLSWNIYMLPGIITQSAAVERARAIGELLRTTDYDVIVFQEAFSGRARRIIWNSLRERYPYTTGPANQKGISFKINSGVWIVSRYPITASQSFAFKLRAGSDAFSRKGALLAELNVNGTPLQVVGTHLQSAGGSAIREEQCLELYHRLLKPAKKSGVAQIICGDFNIDRYSAQPTYRFMLQALNAVDEEEKSDFFSFDYRNNDLNNGNKEGRSSLIDYILVGNNGTGAVCSNRKVTSFKKQWSTSHQDLSDHYSLEAEIQLSGASETTSANDTLNVQTPATTLTPLVPHVRGFYVAPEYQVVRIADQYATVAGITAAVQLSQKWSAGITGYTTFDHLKPSEISANHSLGLNVMLAGARVEYTPHSKSLIHLSFPLIVGLGVARIDSSYQFKNHNYPGRPRGDDAVIVGRGSFLTLQPGINAEANLTKYTKLYMGVAYRVFAGDVDSAARTTPQQTELRGMTFSVGVKIGLFDHERRR